MSSTTSNDLPPEAATTTTTTQSQFIVPELFDCVCTMLEKSCTKSLLRSMEKLLRASNTTTFERNRDNILNSIASPIKLDDFIESYMPALDNCWLLATDKTKLRLIVKSLLHSDDVKDTEPPLSINGRLGMCPYDNPELNETEALAHRLYTEFHATCKDQHTIEMINDALVLLNTSIRVRSYVDQVNAMEVKTSRHAPVTRETGYSVHYTCNCDKNNKGFVRVSGCAKCCVNMPDKVSVCKCQQHFRVLKEYDDIDLTCNHPGQFDATKFSMMFLRTHICSICSEQTDGNCQHRVFALDVDALYYSDVANPADMDYVHECLARFNSSEELFHRALKRKRNRALDSKSRASGEYVPKRVCVM